MRSGLLWQQSIRTSEPFGSTAVLCTKPTYINRMRFSSCPTIRTGGMVSVSASYGNLSSAPWDVVASQYHTTAGLGSPRGHACPGTHQPPGFIRYLCSPQSLISRRFPPQHTLTISPCFSWPIKPLLFRAILNLCSYLLLVRSVVIWEPSVSFRPTASQWELRSTLTLSPGFLCSFRNFRAADYSETFYLLTTMTPGTRCGTLA